MKRDLRHMQPVPEAEINNPLQKISTLMQSNIRTFVCYNRTLEAGEAWFWVMLVVWNKREECSTRELQCTEQQKGNWFNCSAIIWAFLGAKSVKTRMQSNSQKLVFKQKGSVSHFTGVAIMYNSVSPVYLNKFKFEIRLINDHINIYENDISSFALIKNSSHKCQVNIAPWFSTSILLWNLEEKCKPGRSTPVELMGRLRWAN